jgi:hypothetical protein
MARKDKHRTHLPSRSATGPWVLGEGAQKKEEATDDGRPPSSGKNAWANGRKMLEPSPRNAQTQPSYENCLQKVRMKSRNEMHLERDLPAIYMETTRENLQCMETGTKKSARNGKNQRDILPCEARIEFKKRSC